MKANDDDVTFFGRQFQPPPPQGPFGGREVVMSSPCPLPGDDECPAGGRRAFEMGFAAGGRIREELRHAGNKASDFDVANSLRVFVHLLNAEESEYVLGKKLPREDEWP